MIWVNLQAYKQRLKDIKIVLKVDQKAKLERPETAKAKEETIKVGGGLPIREQAHLHWLR